jgi:hypothetical protein
MRAISYEDAVSVVELGGQLGYEGSVAETRELRILLALRAARIENCSGVVISVARVTSRSTQLRAVWFCRRDGYRKQRSLQFRLEGEVVE